MKKEIKSIAPVSIGLTGAMLFYYKIHSLES